MSCGIYSIVNKVTGKRYVGKSINIEKRWRTHLSELRRSERKRGTNRHLFADFKKYSEDSFGFEYTEVLDENEELLAERELFWMKEYNSLDREFGYNLRYDSDTRCFVSSETKLLLSANNTGVLNPNFGNKWTEEQKLRASEIALLNHSLGRYRSEETLKKHSESSKLFWQNNKDKLEQMKNNVSKSRTTYQIGQYSKSGELIKVWETMYSLLIENPDYFRIAIYNCMNGHKKSYRGFVWRKII